MLCLFLSFPGGPLLAAPDWNCYEISPWAGVKEETMPATLFRPLKQLSCRGLREDWVTAAVGVKSQTADHRLTVSLDAPPDLKEKIALRIAGMGNYREGGFVPDPLFAAGDFNERQPLGRYLSNWSLIHEFPSFTVKPEQPAMLWLTLHTAGLKAGLHRFRLVFQEEGKKARILKGSLRVMKAALPADNPLYCFLWQYIPRPPAAKVWVREHLAHGVNVFHQELPTAVAEGGQFFIFPGPRDAWRMQPLTAEARHRVTDETGRILAAVADLGIKKGRWALYITDEPKDADYPLLIEYARIIRDAAPDILIYTTLPWGPGPQKNEWATAKGVRQLADAKAIDIWQPYWWHSWDGGGTWEIMRQSGKPVWMYEIIANNTRNPQAGVGFYRMGHWQAFKYDVEGLGIFAGYDFQGDPWNDLDKANDYYLYYWYGKDGFLTTRAFEAYRQGVQEYKLLDALKKAGVPQKWLNQQVEAALKAKSPEELDAIRLRLAVRLEKTKQR